MLIRSQYKMPLVKFENIVVNINNINGKEIIFWSQMNPGEDEYISLGHYSTKEKTMKVLDMIQEAYANVELIPMAVPNIRNMFTEAIGKAIMNKMIFQMPEDGSV